MPFLRSYWYVAAWSSEVTRTPMRRILLDEPVVFYRKEDGATVAMRDSCPHRFVPLSRGKVHGDDIACGYHGLRFGPDGRCTLNPHDMDASPPKGRVKTYPVEERFGALWIWMGDPAAADPAIIPDYGFIADREHYATASGYVHVEAACSIIVDNLLDISHAQFLHSGNLSNHGAEARIKTQREGNSVWAMRWLDNCIANDVLCQFWPRELSDSRAHSRWDPPATVLIDIGVTGVGRPVEEGRSLPNLNFLTPETESSTHYFWTFSRNFELENEELTAMMRQVTDHAFRMEDKPVLEAQQANMRGAELFELNPISLSSDAPAILARRLHSQLLRKEQV